MGELVNVPGDVTRTRLANLLGRFYSEIAMYTSIYSCGKASVVANGGAAKIYILYIGTYLAVFLINKKKRQKINKKN